MEGLQYYGIKQLDTTKDNIPVIYFQIKNNGKGPLSCVVAPRKQLQIGL